MPIGTSNGDTFETQWDHAMQEFAHMYLKQSLDRPYDGDLPVGNHKQIYNDQPTPEAQRREYNKSAQYSIHDFKNLETNMENTQFFSDQTTNEDLPINGGVKPQNVSDIPQADTETLNTWEQILPRGGRSDLEIRKSIPNDMEIFSIPQMPDHFMIRRTRPTKPNPKDLIS